MERKLESMRRAEKVSNGGMAVRQLAVAGRETSHRQHGVRSWRLSDLSWSRACTLTAFHVSRTHVSLVSGDHLRGDFHASHWATAVRSQEQPLEETLRILVHNGHPPRGRVCIAMPESELSIRYFTLPSRDEVEIKAMVAHQLRLAVPVPIQQLTWASTLVDQKPSGAVVVMTHILRRDHLEETLKTYRAAGIEVHHVFPQAFILADRCWQAGRLATSDQEPEKEATGTDAEGQALTDSAGNTDTKRGAHASGLLLVQGQFHILVYCEGNPLFVRSFPVALHDANELNSRSSSQLFLESVSRIETARQEFEKIFERPWPEPTYLLPYIPADAADRRMLEELALRFSDRLHIPVIAAKEPEPPVCDTESNPMAHSLFRVGGTCKTNLLADSDMQRVSWIEKTNTLIAAVLTAAAILAIGGLWAFGDVQRMERQRQALESTLARDRENWRDLAAMRRDLTQSTRRDARALAALQALYSTFRNNTPGLRLVEFTYDKNQGVLLVGHASHVATITDFAEKLANTAGWRGVKVQSIHRASTDRDGRFGFEIRAEWLFSRETITSGP